MTDHELRVLMKSDLNAASKALYEQYYRYVYAIVFRLLRDHGTQEDVEDCVADTFAKLITHMDSIRGDDLKAYIGRAAHNNALNRLRSLNRTRKYHVPLEDAAEIAGEDLSLTSEERSMQKQLLTELEALGEPDTTILLQKYWFGASSAQIAKGLGITPSAVRKRANKALGRLRAMLKEQGIEEGSL